MNFKKIISKVVILVIFLPTIFIGCGRKQKSQPTTEKNVYLDSLENLFTKVPDWLATVYDKDSGGFYHNALMAQDSVYATDMQSTNFALSILISGNIVSTDTLNETFKKKVISYVENRYDKTLQLYIDPTYKNKLLKSERNLARAQNMASGMYSRLEIAPPNQKFLNEKSVPPYLSSYQSYKGWHYNQQWSRVWTAFDKIVSNGSLLRQIPKQRADSIVTFIQEYAEENQDADGLWGNGQAMEIRISGAAKYGTFCKNFNIIMPNADKMYGTIMKWFKENKELDFSKYSSCPICVPRNAIRALYYIKPHLSFEIPASDKKLLTQKTFEMLRYYSNPDGGFMKNGEETKIAPLDLNLGEYNTRVSDINGTHLAITTRVSLYSLLGRTVPKINLENHQLKILNNKKL